MVTTCKVLYRSYLCLCLFLGEGLTMVSTVERVAVFSKWLSDKDQKVHLQLGEEFESTEDLDRIGRSYYQLAKIHYDKADFKESEKLFKESLKYAHYPRDIFSAFKTYGFLIRIASESLNDSSANDYINTCIELFEKWESSLGSLNSHYFFSRGVLYNYQGKFDHAKDLLLKALDRSKQENEPEVLSKSIYTLASIEYHQKNPLKALEYLNELFEILQIVEKSYLRGSMNMLYAQVHTSLNNLNEAMTYYLKASKYFQKKKSWNQIGYTLLGNGNISKKSGHFEKSMFYYRLALELSDSESFKRLTKIVKEEIDDLNDSNVDIYLDRSNRKILEKSLGIVNFKHRFVLLEILFLLAKNPGHYYDKHELAETIWKENYNPLIHDKLIYTSVSRLRKLIEPKNAKGEKRKYLIRGKDGYSFNPEAKIRFNMEPRQVSAHTIANIEITDPV